MKRCFFIVCLLFVSCVFADGKNGSVGVEDKSVSIVDTQQNNPPSPSQTVHIIRVVFDDEETVMPAKATITPKFDDGYQCIAGSIGGNYTGATITKNKVCYVTFSDNVTKRYDVRAHPEWRTVLQDDLVQKNGSQYVPLHRKL